MFYYNRRPFYQRSKIHFINRIDSQNAGDCNCTPLLYFFKYFLKFNILRHDIDYIDYKEILSGDIIIVGGGGLFNVTRSFNSNINKLLSISENVIGWSCGFNHHNDIWSNGENFEDIHYDRFKLLGIRDYNFSKDFNYLPDPSCMLFDQDFPIFRNICIDSLQKSDVGVILHKDLISTIKVDKKLDVIMNNYSIELIINFILTHDYIITNSYHVTYWSLLLNKKTCVLNKFSSKFDYFEIKPCFIYTNAIDDDIIEKIKSFKYSFNNSFLDNCIKLNKKFFKKVCKIIENKKLIKSNDYERFIINTYLHSWNFEDRLRIASETIDRLNKEIELQKNKINQLENKINEFDS